MVTLEDVDSFVYLKIDNKSEKIISCNQHLSVVVSENLNHELIKDEPQTQILPQEEKYFTLNFRGRLKDQNNDKKIYELKVPEILTLTISDVFINEEVLEFPPIILKTTSMDF
jgi:hypothetical protein